MLRLLHVICLNLLLFLGMSQENQKSIRVTLIDTTANHYIFSLSNFKNHNNSVELTRTLGNHYQLVAFGISIPVIFICEKNDSDHQINKGDTLNCRISSISPKCMSDGYEYIGLGEYLEADPNVQLQFCDISYDAFDDYHNSKFRLSIKDKLSIDSYLIYLWLFAKNNTTMTDLAYRDWFYHLVDNAQNVHLTNKAGMCISIYYPNGKFNQEIEYDKVINTMLIFETENKSLVKLSMSDTSLIGLIDDYWIER